MDLLALADFNLVAKHGGFGKAARATGRPKATLSRRVTELEASLGLRLLERGSRILKLTEEGRALFERTASLLTSVDEAAAEIASGGKKPRGQLKISAPLVFSQTAMGKLAAGFALKYPEVRLEVTTEDRMVDMIDEGYDLVIRVNPSPEERSVGRIFLRDRLVVVASPKLARPAKNKKAPAVQRGGDGATIWDLVAASGRSRITVEPVLQLSSLLLVRDAVRMGVGAGCLPISLVSKDLSKGSLVLWGNVEKPEIALWALYPTRRLLSAKVSAFLEYLKESFPEGSSEELANFLDS